MVELQHEPHDAKHIGVAAYGRRVDGKTALYAFCEEIAEIGKSRCQARCRERRDAHVGTGFGNHLAFLR